MFKIIKTFVTILLISSCASHDRMLMTDFEMTSQESWTMKVQTASNYKPNDEQAEEIRINWLTQFTQENKCSGFEITSRVWTKSPTDNFIQTGFSESVGKLVYKGICN